MKCLAKKKKDKNRLVLRALEVPRSLNELAQVTGIGKRELRDRLHSLKESGYDIRKEGQYYYIEKHGYSRDSDYVLDLPEYFKIGVVSDTHIGSKASRIDALNDFYEFAKREGVYVVFHGGDLLDGVGVYSGQEANLSAFTLEDQIDLAIREYPKNGLETLMISGNHDLKQYQRGRSPDPVQVFANRREDIQYLGKYYARIVVSNSIVYIDLIHPSHGTAYAVSYHVQKYIERIKPGDKPNILIWGHQHDAMYIFYRNIHTVKAGSFQDQTEYSLRKGLYTTVGGWILEGRHDGEEVKYLRAMFKPYY